MEGCFKGSEFGGEDFYFGFAKAINVPGKSWAMNFNHDYVDSGLKIGGRFSKRGETAEYYETISKWWHPYRLMSSLSGGFELTIPDSQFVAVNFEFCMFGKSQGGACNDKVTKEDAQKRAKEEGQDWENPQSLAKPLWKEKEDWIQKRIWAKNDALQRDLNAEEMAEIYRLADQVFKKQEDDGKMLWLINRFYGTTFEGGVANTWCGGFELSDR